MTWLPSRAKACASSSATTDEPITARRSGTVSLTSASVDVQYGDSFRPGIGGTAGLAPVATRQRVEHHDALTTLVQTDDNALVVLETSFTMQNGDG